MSSTADSRALSSIERNALSLLPPGAKQELPGFCYLALFADNVQQDVAELCGAYPVRSVVERAVQSSTAQLHGGTLTVVFGTPASVSQSQKFQVHVERAPIGSSLVRPKDVPTLMPPGSRYGDNTPAPEQASSAQPADVPTPATLHPSLGSVPDPTKRRFKFKVTTLKVPGEWGTYMVNSFDPTNQTTLVQFTRFAQFAQFVSLSVHFIPVPAANAAMVHLDTAWFPDNETAPDGETAFNLLPTRDVHVIGPQYPGGTPPSLVVDCPMAYGIQRLIRPKPHFGGRPKFAWRWTSGQLDPAPKLVKDTELYHVYLETVVDLSPP